MKVTISEIRIEMQRGRLIALVCRSYKSQDSLSS